MSDQPVAELFADLGFDVDKTALATAERGIAQVEQAANRAVVAVERMGGALARAGAGTKPGFWSGIAQSFRQGMEEGKYPRAGDSDFIGPVRQKPSFVQGIKDSFNQGWADGLKEIENESVATPRAPHAPPTTPGGGHGPGAPPAPHAPPGGGHGGGGHGGAAGLTGFIEKATHVTHGFLALFAGHQVLHFAHELMEMGSHLELSSKRLGVSTEALQQLQYAANASDISAESLNTGLKFLQVNSTKAAEGSKAQAGAFRELGVAVKGADGAARPVDELLQDVADHFAEIKDPAKQSAVAMQLFGRSGVELVPMLQQGGEGIRKLREEAEALGGGLTETLLENAGEYEHALKAFNFAFLGVKSAIGNFLLPILTKLSQALTWLSGRFNYLYNSTKFFQTLLAVGLVAALMKVVLWLDTVGKAGVIAWLKNVGGFILLAAVIAGVSLVLEDLYQALTGGKSVIGKWFDNWRGLGATSQLVKDIALGFDSINTSVKELIKNPLDRLGGFFKGLGRTLTGADIEKESYVGPDGKTYWRAKDGQDLNSKLDASANEQANRPVALGRGVGADAQSNVDIPRATGRGLGADAATSFGQAKGSIFNPTSASNGNDSPVNVTINAHTNASPKEIARHAKTAIEEHQQKQNRNIRRALVPHAEP